MIKKLLSILSNLQVDLLWRNLANKYSDIEGASGKSTAPSVYTCTYVVSVWCQPLKCNKKIVTLVDDDHSRYQSVSQLMKMQHLDAFWQNSNHKVLYCDAIGVVPRHLIELDIHVRTRVDLLWYIAGGMNVMKIKPPCLCYSKSLFSKETFRGAKCVPLLILMT